MSKLKKVLLTVATSLLVSISLLFFISCNKSTGTANVKYTFNNGDGPAIESVSVPKGNDYELPAPPAREGYSFEGWYTSADFSGEAVTTVKAEESLTYYAKWEKLALITLQSAGGSLSTSKLYVKNGANIYEAVKDYVPQKSGCEFGAWLDGTAELSKTKKITADGITLTAKYKVGYTVEIWLQKLTLDGYEKVADDIKGFEYAGKQIAPEQEVTGFDENLTPDGGTPIREKTISENASENVFKYYFDRNTYTLTFNPNYPDGTSGENVSSDVLYGKEVEVPSDYEAEGYLLLGWSTSATATEPQYKANYLEKALFNGDGEEIPSADKVMPARRTTLYGVWAKGYVNMFTGSGDYIYVLDENSEVAYISRGGVYFQGEYDPEDRDFTFWMGKDLELLEGKLTDNGTYIYYDTSRASKVATLFIQGKGAIQSTKIYFDAYDGFRYSINGTDNTNATYVINETGYYEAKFAEGEEEGSMAGKEIVFILTTASDGSLVFLQRNDEEYNMGLLSCGVVYEGGLTTYVTAYSLSLSGFGLAAYNTGASNTTYYYTYNEEKETYTFTDANGRVQKIIKLVDDIQGKKAYMNYNEAQDQTFTFADSTKTLTLDGLCEATYFDGTTSVTGYYTARSSVFGGIIVNMTANKQTYTFLILEESKKITVTEKDESTGQEVAVMKTVTTYTVTEKAPGYAEYYHKNDSETPYYAPLVVIDEPTVGKAVVYAYDVEKKEYVKASDGTYRYDETTGLYTYTAENVVSGTETMTGPIDITGLVSFVFALSDTASEQPIMQYNINYWYSLTTGEGTTEYNVEYEDVNTESKATLTIVAGIAIYVENSNTYTGLCATDANGVTTVATKDGTFYFELTTAETEGEKNTFLKLKHAPYKAYLLGEDGQQVKNVYVSFDGKGGATYNVVTVEGEEEVVTPYTATLTETGKTSESGAAIWKLTYTDGQSVVQTIEYIELSTSSRRYIAPYNATYNGVYDSDEYGKLTLDGFGYMAYYKDYRNDSEYEGVYVIAEENVVVMIVGDEYLYFDLKAERDFSVRGEEYGTYLFIDNQTLGNLYYLFDGYGKLSVYKTEGEGDDEQRVYIDENGTYTQEGDTFTLKYTANGSPVEFKGELGVFVYGSYGYYAFFVSHKEAINTFVNEKDWSVLELDEFGNATKYTKDGKKETGAYVLITDTLLYYVNSAGSDACIYDYNVADGTATPIKFTPRGYYTTDLESLLFQEYGFAIFNGTERVYYNEVRGNIVLYKYEPENPNANKYGYVEDDSFGKLEATEVYNGKTYYENGGFKLTFDRKDDNKDVYKVKLDDEMYAIEKLVFQPTGEAQFSVTGWVTLNGTDYPCTVVRSVGEDDSVEMYVLLSHDNGKGMGNLRFDIQMAYVGKTGNTYTVTDMKHVIDLLPYGYYDGYYIAALLDMLIGTNKLATYSNTLGTFSVVTEYNEDGSEKSSLLSANFLEDSGMKLDDKLLVFDKVAYDYKDGAFTLDLTGEDGFTYHVYFMIEKHQLFGVNTFTYVLTREQNVETEDKAYSVNVERVVMSDMWALGYLWDIELLQGTTTLEPDIMWTKDGKICYVVRTVDEETKVITATTYYVIELVEEQKESVEGEDNKEVALYTSVVIIPESITTMYTENGKVYVDISATDGVVYLYLNGNRYLAESCTYDEATKTYTVITTVGNAYMVQIDGDKVIVTAAQID